MGICSQQISVSGSADTPVDQCVETLCNQGCGRVSEVIAALRAGDDFAEVAGFSEAERKVVLAELEDVMSPYLKRSADGQSCRVSTG